ncbi:hypothetical protein [Pantoea agglomerans]
MPDNFNDLPYEPDYEENVESHFKAKELENYQADKDIKARENLD